MLCRGQPLKKRVPSLFFCLTEYTGKYIYKNGNLEFFNHPEGYVEKEADGYEYTYQYKDHLGNIRLSYADSDNNGSITASEIKEEKNYYPFGSMQKGYNEMIRGRKHQYGYNGKEEQNELDFNTLDFGARFYDPALGRWFTPDALAEKYYSDSTYGYALNNPILYIDPDGNQVAMCCEKLQGFVAGMVDNTFGTNIRSKGATAEFRTGVQQANGVSLAISTILLIDGTVSTGAGTGGLAASGVAAATGVGAPEGAIGAAASAGLLAKGAAELTVGSIMLSNTINNMNEDAQNGNGNSSSSSSSSNEKYSPDRKIENDKKTGNPVIDEEASSKSHTQLGTNRSRNTGQNYAKRRTIDENGKVVNEVEFTDHGRPQNHTNPHQHKRDPNTGKRLPAEPLDN